MFEFLSLFIFIPLFGTLLIIISSRAKEYIPKTISFLTISSILVVLVYFIRFYPRTFVFSVENWSSLTGIALVVDPLSILFLLMVNIIGFIINLYSFKYIEQFSAQWKFYSLFLLMILGMNGLLISHDLFTIFLFLEIASLSSYALVAFGTEEEELEASFKYMILGTIASCCILLAIALIYAFTYSINLEQIGSALSENPNPLLIKFITALFIAGFGLKAAIVPFHAWLPDAHPSAPAPISAILSGVLVKVLGIYTLFRLLYNVIGFTNFIANILIIAAVLSMLVGSILAFYQSDIKRLFAYSTIGQIGYIILGFSLSTPLGIMGALFHIINHSIFKTLLFLNTGSIEYITGTRDLNNLGNLRKYTPITATTSLIGSLSISGIPPFNGFWSKLIIIIATVQSGYIFPAVIAVICSIITLVYTMKFQHSVFWKNGVTMDNRSLKKPSFFMNTSVIIFAILCVFSSLLVLPSLNNEILGPAVQVLTFGKNYAKNLFGLIP